MKTFEYHNFFERIELALWTPLRKNEESASHNFRIKPENITLEALHFTFKNEGGVRSTLPASVLHSIFFLQTSKHFLILSLAAPNLYHYDTAVIIRILIQTSRQSFISRISNSYFQVIFVPTFSTCFHMNQYFLS